MYAKMTVNGDPVEVDVEPRVLLVDLLRDSLGLTGAKVGCDTGQCGTCVVDVNGRSEKSCTMLAVQAIDADITTIEGLSEPGSLDDLQNALWQNHGVQCGFCIPGVTMSLRDLLERAPSPTEEQVRSWLSGNLCRCTGYHSFVRAVLSLDKADAGEQENGK